MISPVNFAAENRGPEGIPTFIARAHISLQQPGPSDCVCLSVQHIHSPLSAEANKDISDLLSSRKNTYLFTNVSAFTDMQTACTCAGSYLCLGLTGKWLHIPLQYEHTQKAEYNKPLDTFPLERYITVTQGVMTRVIL